MLYYPLGCLHDVRHNIVDRGAKAFGRLLSHPHHSDPLWLSGSLGGHIQCHLLGKFISTQSKRKYSTLIFVNRVIVKLFILVLPILATIAYFKEFFLLKRSIITFMMYQIVMSILLLIHMIYSWFYAAHFDFQYLAEY